MMFAKYRIRKLKIQIAGLKAEIAAWHKVEQDTGKSWPFAITQRENALGQAKAELKDRISRV